MARDAAEPTGSMGNDTALAVLSDMRPAAVLLLQAAVRAGHEPGHRPDPRVDRDEPRGACIGPEINLLDETPDHCHQLVMPQPILRNAELEKLRQVDHSVFEARTIDMTWPVGRGRGRAWSGALEEICARGVRAGRARREHHHPVRPQHRRRARRRCRRCWPRPPCTTTSSARARASRSACVVETGEAREIHHLACLIGYGASAVNPYLMFESLYALHREGRLPEGMTPDEAEQRAIKAIGKGLLKILSKMGISTIRSYTGAQIFEAVGPEEGARRPPLHGHAVARRRRRAERARRRGARPPRARLSRPRARELLPPGGIYAWRRGGEYHGWNPETIATLQQAAREEDGADAYERFATYVNDVAVPQHLAARAAPLPRRRPSRCRSTRSSPPPRSSSASSRAACRSARSRPRRTRRSPSA